MLFGNYYPNAIDVLVDVGLIVPEEFHRQGTIGRYDHMDYGYWRTFRSVWFPVEGKFNRADEELHINSSNPHESDHRNLVIFMKTNEKLPEQK